MYRIVLLPLRVIRSYTSKYKTILPARMKSVFALEKWNIILLWSKALFNFYLFIIASKWKPIPTIKELIGTKYSRMDQVKLAEDSL